MAFNPNSAKHKANHKGYKTKPTQQQVKALLGLYSNNNPQPNTNFKTQPTQLKLF
jgi:hypothetical protein|tara:strand:- start:1543 stop:1707 length:165 start_codon:yes stop_codon:yes gene_type:complete